MFFDTSNSLSTTFILLYSERVALKNNCLRRERCKLKQFQLCYAAIKSKFLELLMANVLYAAKCKLNLIEFGYSLYGMSIFYC